MLAESSNNGSIGNLERPPSALVLEAMHLFASLGHSKMYIDGCEICNCLLIPDTLSTQRAGSGETRTFNLSKIGTRKSRKRLRGSR